MRSYLVAFAGLMMLSGSPALAAVEITVDKDNQMMTVAVDGAERYHWPVSTGIPSRETPSGTFRTFRMEADHYSKEFDDAPMPHSIFFTKVGHAIHGTDSESRLGTPASHGCVRLSKANATTLYELVEKEGVLKTTVTLTGSAADALAHNPRRGTAVARRDVTQPDAQQYSNAGEPVVLTQQPQYIPGRQVFPQQQVIPQQQMMPQQRADDGYIYPADGSDNGARYPAPPAGRRVYGAQAYPQQQYYAQQPRYYQPRATYQAQPRDYYNSYQD